MEAIQHRIELQPGGFVHVGPNSACRILLRPLAEELWFKLTYLIILLIDDYIETVGNGMCRA